MKTIVITLMILFTLFTCQAYAESLDIAPGLWEIEYQRASNLYGAKQRTCITQDSISSPVRNNMILSCAGKLLASSTRTNAEWELICPNGKNQKLQVKAVSRTQLEGVATPLGYKSNPGSKAYQGRSRAKWLSADCGNAPIFPASQ